jgi:hypothetical protein
MLGCGVNGNTLGCYPRDWEFDPLRPSHFSGSRLDGKPPALGAGESEFDSRDPDFEWGVDVVGGMRVLQTRWTGSSPVLSTISIANFGLRISVTRIRDSMEFGARVAQRKSDTPGEGLMRVQVSPRAPTVLRIAELRCGAPEAIQSAI